MLTNPREALAEQSSFVSYLVGLAGLARVVRTLATDGNHRHDAPHEADDLVHLLLGLASVGEAVERLAGSAPAQRNSAASAPSTNTRWLR
jgi:hypothetical protein